MTFIADLHIHSYYSRATSKKMNLENLYKWAQIKGVSVIATGDFTHPEWFAELKEKLEPGEPGFFKIKEEYKKEIEKDIPVLCKNEVSFVLSAEVSSIYSKGGKCRKIHNLLYSPDFKTVSNISNELSKIGDLRSDGRPILGLDAKKLLKIVLDSGDGAMLIPAHAWTPHFSVFGAGSGFDSIEECFEELTPHIHAIETGLSSDPLMNGRISALDNITLISNSDAHSLEKIGREANIFDTEKSYFAMKDAIENPDSKGFTSTIEFFPEEGKYHLDGHRACNVRLTPKETRKNSNLCPECDGKVTIGVMHRVDDLSDRDAGYSSSAFPLFVRLIPLAEIIAAILKKGIKTKTVEREYMKIISALGNELDILRYAKPDSIKSVSSHDIASAIVKVRNNEVKINPGYDGEYGTIDFLDSKNDDNSYEQLNIV